MNSNKSIEQLVHSFMSEELEKCHIIKDALIEAVASKEIASKVVLLLKDCLITCQSEQEIGNKGFYKEVSNPELVVIILEILHKCFKTGADLAPVIVHIAHILYIDKRESDKSKIELYIQFCAAAILDLVISSEISFSQEVIGLILADVYRSDKLTEEYMCDIYCKLAEQGVNISSKIKSLLTTLHNEGTLVLMKNSLLALWAAVRGGCFDTKIPNSDNTYNLWLWHLVTKCVWKLKPKYEEVIKLGAVGCLIETAIRYPQTRFLILECMEKWGIREPKRPRTVFKRDLVQLFSYCRENPGITCLPSNIQIGKRGIMYT
ncbi:hypothetical protein [Clostridium ganghwense]|uniref:DUF2785 domain-containing protein n=1 Tax=Clostridium ganghwense TaxID=312089 RepID=A0ABT4CRL3_9CLOT|nr:hypothetical protein [Clostridium ganghwense]MCY6371682.1 hypothetical protein [Clostridium ganghwense]